MYVSQYNFIEWYYRPTVGERERGKQRWKQEKCNSYRFINCFKLIAFNELKSSCWKRRSPSGKLIKRRTNENCHSYSFGGAFNENVGGVCRPAMLTKMTTNIVSLFRWAIEACNLGSCCTGQLKSSFEFFI